MAEELIEAEPTNGKKIWYAVPSSKGQGSWKEWKDAGFNVAMLGENQPKDESLDVFIHALDKEYLGYPWAIKRLMDYCFTTGDLVLVGSDDVFPTTSCNEYVAKYLFAYPNLDGLVEPSGGKKIGERQLCICPMVGREFFSRYNQGRGIYDTSYSHFYADQELSIASEQMGKLTRDDSIRFDHRHWTKDGSNRPDHMIRWKAGAQADEDNFHKRRANGFKDAIWQH